MGALEREVTLGQRRHHLLALFQREWISKLDGPCKGWERVKRETKVGREKLRRTAARLPIKETPDSHRAGGSHAISILQQYEVGLYQLLNDAGGGVELVSDELGHPLDKDNLVRHSVTSPESPHSSMNTPASKIGLIHGEEQGIVVSEAQLEADWLVDGDGLNTGPGHLVEDRPPLPCL